MSSFLSSNKSIAAPSYPVLRIRQRYQESTSCRARIQMMMVIDWPPHLMTDQSGLSDVGGGKGPGLRVHTYLSPSHPPPPPQVAGRSVHTGVIDLPKSSCGCLPAFSSGIRKIPSYVTFPLIFKLSHSYFRIKPQSVK